MCVFCRAGGLRGVALLEGRLRVEVVTRRLQERRDRLLLRRRHQRLNQRRVLLELVLDRHRNVEERLRRNLRTGKTKTPRPTYTARTFELTHAKHRFDALPATCANELCLLSTVTADFSAPIDLVPRDHPKTEPISHYARKGAPNSFPASRALLPSNILRWPAALSSSRCPSPETTTHGLPATHTAATTVPPRLSRYPSCPEHAGLSARLSQGIKDGLNPPPLPASVTGANPSPRR